MVKKKVPKKKITVKEAIETPEKVQTASVKQRDYTGELSNSFKLVFNNLSLLLPEILFSVIALLLLGSLFSYFGFGIDIPQSEEAMLQLIKDFGEKLIENSMMLFLLILLGLILILVKLWTSCTKFDMVRSVVKTNKVSFFDSLKNAKNFFWRFLGVNVLVGFVFLVFFLLGSLLFDIGDIFSFILLFVLIVIGVFFLLLLSFIYPVLFLTNSSVMKTFSGSYKFFMNNKMHVVKVLLLIIIISVVISGILNSIANLLSAWAAVFMVYAVVKSLLLLFVDLWGEMYLFRNY